MASDEQFKDPDNTGFIVHLFGYKELLGIN